MPAPKDPVKRAIWVRNISSGLANMDETAKSRRLAKLGTGIGKHGTPPSEKQTTYYKKQRGVSKPFGYIIPNELNRKPRKGKSNFFDPRGCYAGQECRRLTLERDNYTCQHCGVTEGKLRKISRWGLVVHHIFEFENFPSFRYIVSCCLSLCNRCHALVHRTKPTLQRCITLR